MREREHFDVNISGKCVVNTHVFIGAYRKLSALLDWVDDYKAKVNDAKVNICFAIIEEDLQELMAECEDYLFGARSISTCEEESFEARFDTVLEELELILSGL